MSHQSTTTCYTFNNKGCHKSSNFPTTKVFTVYLDKNTLYSVGNPKRKEIEAVFHDERNTLLLRIDCFPISRYLTLQKFSYLNWPLQMGDKIHAYIKKRPIRPANQRWVRAQIVIFAICFFPALDIFACSLFKNSATASILSKHFTPFSRNKFSTAFKL